MAKKCPPGFICFENITLIVIIAILGISIYYFIQYGLNKEKDSPRIIEKHNSNIYVPAPVHQHNIQVPVTVRTQRMEVNYRQVGILTRVNGENTILPLFGRMVNTSRTKWQYYTMNDSNNSIRLPINVNGRSGGDEYGVDELYNGDTVYVEGYDDVFKATIYKNDRFMYNDAI